MNTECVMCMQTFPSLVRLQQHDASKHNAPYTCSLCGNVVAFISELKRLSIHLGVKPQRNGIFVNQTDDILSIACDEVVTTTADLEKHKCVVLEHVEDNPVKLTNRIKMPLTNAEKARNYRERRDRSAEKRKAYLLVEKVRSQKRIMTLRSMPESDKIIQRQRWRESKREQRRKRKERSSATFPQFHLPRHPAKRTLNSNNNRTEVSIDNYIRENKYLRNKLFAEKKKNAELRRQLLGVHTPISIKNELLAEN